MARIFWDKNLFIYLMEQNPNHGMLVVGMHRRMKVRGDRLLTSALTAGETLTTPIAAREQHPGRPAWVRLWAVAMARCSRTHRFRFYTSIGRRPNFMPLSGRTGPYAHRCPPVGVRCDRFRRPLHHLMTVSAASVSPASRSSAHSPRLRCRIQVSSILKIEPILPFRTSDFFERRRVFSNGAEI